MKFHARFVLNEEAARQNLMNERQKLGRGQGDLNDRFWVGMAARVVVRRQARSILARWVDDYNTKRPHSSLGYATPAAFVAGFEQQQAGLTPSVAPPALMRDDTSQSLVAAE